MDHIRSYTITFHIQGATAGRIHTVIPVSPTPNQ